MTLENFEDGARLGGPLQSHGRWALAWLLLPAAALAGCMATGSALVESRVDMGSAPPAKTMLVVLNARSAQFTGLAYDSFVVSLKQRLLACDVSVTIHDVDTLELDVTRNIARTVLQTKPELMVTMVRNGGELMASVPGGVATGKLYYEVSAKQLANSRAVWKAHLTHVKVVEYDKVAGERLAAALVSRMATDGLVAGCPSNVVTPDLGGKPKSAA